MAYWALIFAAALALAPKLEESLESRAIAQTNSAPVYARRGDIVEKRYQAYRGRLQRLYEVLWEELKRGAPDLLPKLEATQPKTVSHGYQILPRLVPDAPVPRSRAHPASYSWPWTERLIEREMQKLDMLEEGLARITALDSDGRRAKHEKVVADYGELSVKQQTIDAHIQYNRLWQEAIAKDRPGYERQTALYDLVLERHAILAALSATDEAAFRKALMGIKGIDTEKPRDALEIELRERKRKLARETQEETDPVAPPLFIGIEHPRARLWIVHVPFYTDIEDTEFIRSFQTAVESLWRVRDGEDEFRVELSITYLSAKRLYQKKKPPGKGEPIDVNAHTALFPEGGAFLTTGAISTHVWGRGIVLGPHDIAPRVLAHELGHILGFKDSYFRAFRELGPDGYEVMEISNDPHDIMGAPGSGPVLRHHFERLLAAVLRKK